MLMVVAHHVLYEIIKHNINQRQKSFIKKIPNEVLKDFSSTFGIFMNTLLWILTYRSPNYAFKYAQASMNELGMRIIEAHKHNEEKQLSSMRWIKMVAHNKKNEGEKKTRLPKGMTNKKCHMWYLFSQIFFPKMLYWSHLFSNSPGHLPCNSQSFLFQLPIADLSIVHEGGGENPVSRETNLSRRCPGHLPCNSQIFLFQLPIGDLSFVHEGGVENPIARGTNLSRRCQYLSRRCQHLYRISRRSTNFLYDLF